MKSFDPATLAFYAREAADYAANGPGGIGARLDAFLARLPRGGSILELGCGAGRDAATMAARGFLVDPTDGVPEMVAEAEALLGRPVRLMRFDQLEADCAYDGVVATYALLHVPIAELVDTLARVWRALKPGGWHVATYKSGTSEGRDRLGRYYNYLSRELAEASYRAAGDWAELSFETGAVRGYEGGLSPWIEVTARKAG